jgi:DNA polymerase I
MVAVGRVAIDIETAPNQTEVDRLADLLHTKAETAGRLKGLKKLKAPASEIAALIAKQKLTEREIKYVGTAGLDPRRARIRLLQVYAGADRVLVVDLDKTGAGVLDLLDGVNVIAHNVSFELSFLEAAGVAPGELHCTLQATRLMLGEYSTSLAAGAAAFLHLDLDKTPQVSDWNAPHLTRQQIDYAAIDAVVAWRIAEKILPRFDVQRSAYEIQVSVVPAVMRMEQRGFKLDVDAHARLIADLKDKRVAAEQDYREACRDGGHVAPANKPAPWTPAQKADLLATLLTSDELTRWRRTEKSGALSTRRSELLRAAHYPPIRALVKLSRIDKRLASFGPTLAALVSPASGRIHAHYHVAGTASGRASYAGPNLQQIPRTSELADFRALFVPEPDYVFVVADYAMMEMRGAAYISGDRAMTEAFEQGLDLHKVTAARMIGGGNGKDIADVTEEERKGAKAVNFGAIFGQGAAGLVKSAWDQWEIVLDLDEARAWVKSFENSYFEYARWRRDHHRLCQSRNHIVIGKNAARGIGRIFPFSRLPEGNNGYTRCCNLPVQGGCADA